MQLKRITRDILERVEEVTGASVQLMRVDGLSVLVTIKMARHGSPFHILQYKPTDTPLDYFAVHQAGYILRLYENAPDARFDFSPSDEGVSVIEEMVKKSSGQKKIDPEYLRSFSELMNTWALMNLRSLPVGMRLDAWIRTNFPELHDLQAEGLAIQQQQNLSILSLSQNGLRVPIELMGTIAGYALFTDRLLENSSYAIPYRSAGLLDDGARLLKVWDSVPSTATHDRELIDSWSSATYMNNWYKWIPFKS